MISSILDFTQRTLSGHIRDTPDFQKRGVVLGRIVEPNGTVDDRLSGNVVICLANIVKQSSLSGTLGYKSPASAQVPVPSNYTLYILCTAFESNYLDVLRLLDVVMKFFDATPVMNHRNFPGLPTEIEKLEFAMENLSFEQLQSVWTAMGAKYQPSVVYKVSVTRVFQGPSSVTADEEI